MEHLLCAGNYCGAGFAARNKSGKVPAAWREAWISKVITDCDSPTEKVAFAGGTKTRQSGLA